MSALSVNTPFPTFLDIDGQPLDAGYIYLGVANQATEANPIQAYWDAALTVAATQPILTKAGFPVNAGVPARVYVNSDYSIVVKNRNGFQVFSSPIATDRYNDAVVNIDSSDVTFIQAGTGAVARTAQAKMRDVVSVKDFGAVGDGVADDTAAIQAALTFVSTSAGPSRLYFPNGTYVVSGTLSYTQATLGRSVTIEGEDEIKTVISFAGSGDCLSFTLGQNSNQTSNRLEIKRLSIKTSVAGAGAAIRVLRTASSTVAPNALFEDLYIFQEGSGYWSYGIRTTDSSDQWFNRCYLMHFGSTTTACVFIDNNLTTQSVYGAYFNGCSFNGATYCLRVTGQLESCYINNSSLVGALDVVSVDATGTTFGNPHLSIAGSHLNGKKTTIASTNWRAITITGTDVYSGVGAGDVAGENISIANAQHVAITGCKFEIGAVAQSRSFVLLNNVVDFSITGNVMNNATAAGILLIGASGRGIVAGNTINGYVDGAPNNEGIYHVATGEGFTFSGNNIYYFSKGITLNSNGNVIVGNLFQNLTTGVEVVGGVNIFAKGNVFRSVTTETTGTLSREIFRTVTVDPASIAAGTRLTQLVTVTGAAVGDFVDFSAPYDVQDLTITANVQNTNTVALYFKNDTGSTKDLASGDWKFRIHS